MSDDRHQTRACLDAETLAAFIDGRLEPREREAVEAHLAECEDCYEVWMEANAATVNRDVATSSRRRIGVGTYAAVGLAATILLGTWTLLPRSSQDTPVESVMTALVDAVGTHRFSEARLAAPFAWGPVPTAVRSSSTDETPYRRAALELQAAAAGQTDAKSLSALGTAALAQGQLDDALRHFEKAVLADPADANARTNLAAARLERYRITSTPSDASAALQAARAAVDAGPLTPAALFNLGLALEAAGNQDEALAAWNHFLSVDSTSSWADEARVHIARLKQGRKP